MKQDVWKPIKDFDGYLINERTGEILSRKILKPGTHKSSGAKFVILARNGERHHKYLHKLYQETFNKKLAK